MIDFFDKYHCCNYCDYFLPMGNGLMGQGRCARAGSKFRSEFFDHGKYCIAEFKKTIRNHYNVESPEYIKEYTDAKNIKYKLEQDMHWHEFRQRLESIYCTNNFTSQTTNETSDYRKI